MQRFTGRLAVKCTKGNSFPFVYVLVSYAFVVSCLQTSNRIHFDFKDPNLSIFTNAVVPRGTASGRAHFPLLQGKPASGMAECWELAMERGDYQLHGLAGYRCD